MRHKKHIKYVPLDLGPNLGLGENIAEHRIKSLVCPRCSKNYEGSAENIKNKQVNNCASSIRVSKDIPDDVRILYSFDGPPSPSLVKIGETYVQTFYGSRLDGRYYRFNDLSDEDTLCISDLSKKYPWVMRDACICDNCIEKLTEEGVLQYAGILIYV